MSESPQVLVVDDSRSARFAMRMYLERCDFTVATAENAEQAYAFLKAQRPLIIFLDYLMPQVDGLQVLQVLKRDPHTRDIPVVIWTSFERVDFAVQARAHGAVDVLHKPPSMEKLVELLRRLNAPVTEPPPLELSAPVGQVMAAAGPKAGENSAATPPAESVAAVTESADRYLGLRDEITGSMRRLTDEVFVQLAELKQHMVEVDARSLSETENSQFRRIAREEADGLNQAVKNELEFIRKRIETVSGFTQGDRADVIEAARSAAAIEAQTVAQQTVEQAAEKLSTRLIDALTVALKSLR